MLTRFHIRMQRDNLVICIFYSHGCGKFRRDALPHIRILLGFLCRRHRFFESHSFTRTAGIFRHFGSRTPCLTLAVSLRPRGSILCRRWTLSTHGGGVTCSESIVSTRTRGDNLIAKRRRASIFPIEDSLGSIRAGYDVEVLSFTGLGKSILRIKHFRVGISHADSGAIHLFFPLRRVSRTIVGVRNTCLLGVPFVVIDRSHVAVAYPS
mmetsp:Transcript_13594/g.25781  ORF Transcript_13594/g.25781 Transcript_13594/m.25781 type:complete len:209 (-) Transcript_13594:248-874(-)